jgi:sn-glycerol 3-phosphate transport system substrate-binding protein
LSELVARFNGEQKEVAVHLVSPGAGAKRSIMALRPASAPLTAGEVLPPATLVREAALLLPEAAAVVADARGRLQALPLALSAPVLYYDKQAFRKAGLDPERAPKTWFEVQQAADKLFDAGSTCPFTSSEAASLFVEQISVWHGDALFSRERRPVVNGLMPIKHVALMASWYKSRFMKYFGRRDEADGHFLSGECGMLTSGSQLYPQLLKAGRDVGVARLPVYDDIPGAPKHTLADGLALSIAAGHPKAEYKAVSRFLRFLISPAVQTELVGKYGFLPFAAAGLAVTRSPALAAGMPQQAIALAQVAGSRETQRLAQLPKLRQIVEEELEAVWAGSKPAKEALDTAMLRAVPLPPLPVSARGKLAASDS